MPFQFANLDQRAFEDPRGLLDEFIMQLEQLLVNLLYETVEDFDFKPDFGEDIETVRLGLTDARENNIFNRARAGISDIATDALEATRLIGNGLLSKLKGLVSMGDKMRKGLRKALTYLLDMVNAVLSSIANAAAKVTSLVIDAIAELKDLIKAHIDLANGW
ncbi:hypothetical protein HHL25_22105 [Rhizobium sp. S-51]|uniref:Uncharacterized protein n=1 Tax=Rhizobium terricola TaxID=2728849 RepID=A0A7Y0B0L6_9HYPH|nr:hypothetical protein [Rhizobium terricola]NML76838.1 hypothetical protein [Rhizobium terricola]